MFSEDKLFSTYEEVQKYGEGNNYTEWYKLEHQIENNNGIKETEGKLYYELSWEFIEEMAKRMANNKSNKYPLFNWKKNINVEDLKQTWLEEVDNTFLLRTNATYPIDLREGYVLIDNRKYRFELEDLNLSLDMDGDWVSTNMLHSNLVCNASSRIGRNSYKKIKILGEL